MSLIKSAGGEACFFRSDVSNFQEVRELVEKTVSCYGRLDFAHNNAGILGPSLSFLEWKETDLELY